MSPLLPARPALPFPELEAALDPVLHILAWTPQTIVATWALRSAKGLTVVHVEGVVKVPAAAGTAARDARAAIYAGFESAIAAIEAAGWWHHEHPVLRLDGQVEVKPATHALDGTHVVQVGAEERHLTLVEGRVEFRVSPVTTCTDCEAAR